MIIYLKLNLFYYLYIIILFNDLIYLKNVLVSQNPKVDTHQQFYPSSPAFPLWTNGTAHWTHSTHGRTTSSFSVPERTSLLAIPERTSSLTIPGKTSLLAVPERNLLLEVLKRTLVFFFSPISGELFCTRKSLLESFTLWLLCMNLRRLFQSHIFTLLGLNIVAMNYWCLLAPKKNSYRGLVYN